MTLLVTNLSNDPRTSVNARDPLPLWL